MRADRQTIKHSTLNAIRNRAMAVGSVYNIDVLLMSHTGVKNAVWSMVFIYQPCSCEKEHKEYHEQSLAKIYSTHCIDYFVVQVKQIARLRVCLTKRQISNEMTSDLII